MMVAFTVLVLVAALVCGVAAAIAFGGPRPLAAMASVSDGFKLVDLLDLPPMQSYIARDGAELAYRAYHPTGADTNGCVVLVHGSASRSDKLHSLARGFARAGYAVCALDVRGHGESGHKGRIAYVGQLEDDLEDFVTTRCPHGKTSLVGFSAGGGFVLRFAADRRRQLFRNYLLMAPFLSQAASTYRPASGGWISVGLPRILGLLVLNRIGITQFNDLAVTAFALSPQAQAQLTPGYSFALAMNFRPHHDYRADIAAATQPMEVLVGEHDDQFHAERFAAEFRAATRSVPVSVAPGIGHIDLTIVPAAVQAAVASIDRMSGTVASRET